MMEHIHTPSGRTSPLSDEEENKLYKRRGRNQRDGNSHIKRTNLLPPSSYSSQQRNDTSVPNFLPPGSKVYKAKCACGGHHFLFSIPKEANYSSLLNERKSMEQSIHRLREQVTHSKEQRHDLSQEEIKRQAAALSQANRKIEELSNLLREEKQKSNEAVSYSDQLTQKMKDRKKKFEVLTSQLRAYEKKCRDCESENKSLFSQLATLKGAKNNDIEKILSLKKQEIDERERRSLEEAEKLSKKADFLERKNKSLQKELDNHRRIQARELQEAMRVARKAGGGGGPVQARSRRRSGLISRDDARKSRRGKIVGGSARRHNRSVISTGGGGGGRALSTGRARPGSKGFLYSSFAGSVKGSDLDAKNRSAWAELRSIIQNLVIRNVELAKQLMQETHKKNREAEKWQNEYEKTKRELIKKVRELKDLKEISSKYSKLQDRTSLLTNLTSERETDLSKLKNKVEEWKTRASQLERAKTKLDLDSKKRESQLTSLRKEKRAMEIKERGEKEKIDKKMKGLTSRVNRLSKADKECRELKEKLKEKERRIDHLENEILKLELQQSSSMVIHKQHNRNNKKKQHVKQPNDKTSDK